MKMIFHLQWKKLSQPNRTFYIYRHERNYTSESGVNQNK